MISKNFRLTYFPKDKGWHRVCFNWFCYSEICLISDGSIT